MIKHTISILVENEFGVLSNISGLFSGRGYNIESITAAPTLDASLTRITIVTSGSSQVIEQIIKQLNKLVNVVKVQDVTAENPINRILAMIKVNLGQKNQNKLKALLKNYFAQIIFADDRCSIIQVVSEESQLKVLVESLKPYGLMEYVNSGNIAIQKGKEVIKA